MAFFKAITANTNTYMWILCICFSNVDTSKSYNTKTS